MESLLPYVTCTLRILALHRSLVDPQLTCFEPDTVGSMMRGLEYHRFFFDAGTRQLSFPFFSTIVISGVFRISEGGGNLLPSSPSPPFPAFPSPPLPFFLLPSLPSPT